MTHAAAWVPVLVHPRPSKPQPAEKPPATNVIFVVAPHERYEDVHGYIGLEYLTREQVRGELEQRLRKQEAADDTVRSELAAVPEGGHIIVHIGRQDLMHANTKWYSYVVSTEEDVLLEARGEEGIPNIRGRDGNWWNVVELPLERPIKDVISVRVTDHQTGVTYTFKVVRNKMIVESGP